MVWYQFLKFLMSLGQKMAARLPDHVTIELPDFGAAFSVIRGLAVVDLLIDVRLLFVVLGAVLLCEAGIMLYAAYRFVVKLIPLP